MKLSELKQGDKFMANGNAYVLNVIEKDFARCEKLSNGSTWKIRLSVDVVKIDDQWWLYQ